MVTSVIIIDYQNQTEYIPDDSHEFTIKGYFSRYEKEEYDYWFVINGQERYFNDIGNLDIDKYVNHNITIKGVGGCGNSFINSIRNDDTGEKWSRNGIDLSICLPIIIIIVIVSIVVILGFCMYNKYKNKDEEEEK